MIKQLIVLLIIFFSSVLLSGCSSYTYIPSTPSSSSTPTVSPTSSVTPAPENEDQLMDQLTQDKDQNFETEFSQLTNDLNQ